MADRIIAITDTSEYGRLSILSNWKLEIRKIIIVGANVVTSNLDIIKIIGMIIFAEFHQLPVDEQPHGSRFPGKSNVIPRAYD